MSVGRGVSIERLLRLLTLMADGRQRDQFALASRFDVCTRTIRRDMEVLDAAGFAVEVDGGRGQIGTRYRIVDPAPARRVAELRRTA